MATTYSPYDPVFYAHHTHIDMLWSEWQNRQTGHFDAYNDDLSDPLVWFGETNPLFNGQPADLTLTYQNSDFEDRTVRDVLGYQFMKAPTASRRLSIEEQEGVHQEIRAPSSAPTVLHRRLAAFNADGRHGISGNRQGDGHDDIRVVRGSPSQ